MLTTEAQQNFTQLDGLLLAVPEAPRFDLKKLRTAYIQSLKNTTYTVFYEAGENSSGRIFSPQGEVITNGTSLGTLHKTKYFFTARFDAMMKNPKTGRDWATEAEFAHTLLKKRLPEASTLKEKAALIESYREHITNIMRVIEAAVALPVPSKAH